MLHDLALRTPAKPRNEVFMLMAVWLALQPAMSGSMRQGSALGMVSRENETLSRWIVWLLECTH